MQEYVESKKGWLKEADAVDKTVERARLRARRLKRKLRERGERAEHEAAGGVQIAVLDRDDEDDEVEGSGAESADDMSAEEGGYAAPSDSEDEEDVEDAGTRHKGYTVRSLSKVVVGKPGKPWLTCILCSFAVAQVTAASARRRRPRSLIARSAPSSLRSTRRRSRCSCWAAHRPR